MYFYCLNNLHGRRITSSYVFNSKESNIALCLAEYLSFLSCFFFLPKRLQLILSSPLLPPLGSKFNKLFTPLLLECLFFPRVPPFPLAAWIDLFSCSSGEGTSPAVWPKEAPEDVEEVDEAEVAGVSSLAIREKHKCKEHNSTFH
jgi:hypothetical protein